MELPDSGFGGLFLGVLESGKTNASELLEWARSRMQLGWGNGVVWLVVEVAS